MNRVLVLGLLTALVASGLTQAARSPGPVLVAPSLRVVRMQPITLVGNGFKPREHVRVTVVREDRNAVRLIDANREGTFVVGFAQLTLRRCVAWSVKASGARGSHAVLKLAAPACASH